MDCWVRPRTIRDSSTAGKPVHKTVGNIHPDFILFVPSVGPLQRLLHHAGDLADGQRLREDGKCMGAPGLFDDQFVELGGEQDARKHRPEFLQHPKRFQSGEPGHVHVQQHYMDGLAVDDFQGLFSIRGRERTKSFRLENALKRFPKAGIVVGDQQGWGFDQHGSFGQLLFMTLLRNGAIIMPSFQMGFKMTFSKNNHQDGGILEDFWVPGKRKMGLLDEKMTYFGSRRLSNRQGKDDHEGTKILKG